MNTKLAAYLNYGANKTAGIPRGMEAALEDFTLDPKMMTEDYETTPRVDYLENRLRAHRYGKSLPRRVTLNDRLHYRMERPDALPLQGMMENIAKPDRNYGWPSYGQATQGALEEAFIPREQARSFLAGAETPALKEMQARRQAELEARRLADAERAAAKNPGLLRSLAKTLRGKLRR